MRKFLVRNFELSTHVVLFGETWSTLRAPRILYPLTVAMAMLIIGDPMTYVFGAAQIIGLVILAIGYYFGFLHFRFFPYTYDELDYEQKYFYLSGKRKGAIPPYRLTPKETVELEKMGRELERQYKASRWKRIKSVLPLVGSILAIVIWYLLWL